MYQEDSWPELIDWMLSTSKDPENEEKPETKGKPKQLPSTINILDSEDQFQCLPDYEEQISLSPFHTNQSNNEQSQSKQKQEIKEPYQKPPPKHIFIQRDFDQQNKNTPRFLVRLAVKYLRNYKEQYPEQIYQIVAEECQKLQRWHLEDKRNVYLINHLKFLFSDTETFTKEGTKLNRKVFRKILLEYAKEELEDPKSQVKANKIDYYRACKVFLMRCMNNDLVKRNQCR